MVMVEIAVPILLGLRYMHKKDSEPASKAGSAAVYALGMLWMLVGVMLLPVAILSWTVIAELPFESFYISLFAIAAFFNGLYFVIWGMRGFGVEVEYRFSHPLFRWVMWWTVFMMVLWFIPILDGYIPIFAFILFGVLTYKKATSWGFV